MYQWDVDLTLTDVKNLGKPETSNDLHMVGLPHLSFSCDSSVSSPQLGCPQQELFQVCVLRLVD